jgi:hypothetical protein
MARSTIKAAPQQRTKMDALCRWLGQLRASDARGFNSIRRVEELFENTTRTDDPNVALRGVLVADDLVLTRQRMFYQLRDGNATPVSIHFVAAHFDLDAIKTRYRKTQEQWRQRQRRVS